MTPAGLLPEAGKTISVYSILAVAAMITRKRNRNSDPGNT